MYVLLVTIVNVMLIRSEDSGQWTIFRLRLRFFFLNMEKIKVKRSILFQISYFRKLVVKKLRVRRSYRDLSSQADPVREN